MGSTPSAKVFCLLCERSQTRLMIITLISRTQKCVVEHLAFKEVMSNCLVKERFMALYPGVFHNKQQK